MTFDRHPRGTDARVLLTSVFGPFAQDDAYGSRSINPMELYHNQVTRVQGPFSLRMFHRSWGIMMIQHNIDAPSTVLDFPTLEQFVDEIRNTRYDIVGISSIIPNIGKARKMCELVREHQPQCTIVVGGHVAGIPDVHERIDADHIVRGDGISWFRKFLGQDESAPIVHPALYAGFGSRSMGIPISQRPSDTAAALIPSVGCPMGCSFCCTSAMFGGKGKYLNFYDSGEDLFRVMCDLEDRLKVRSFFVMDENFLLHRARALGLLDLMKRHEKSWSLYVFSSANALRAYTMEELIGLGISWVWMGLEGENSSYVKLQGTDTHALVRDLQANGIRVLGSTIIGLESHTPENIDGAIDYAIRHDTDFHQFMLYTPVPGTPLYAEHLSKGTILRDVDLADIHGQFRFNFIHPHISREQSEEFLLRAFHRDYKVNGPSIMRIIRTVLQGWLRHRNHPEKRIRERFRHEARGISTVYAGTLWAMERYFRKSNPGVTARIHDLQDAIGREFGLKARL
ncbi:MAG: cobalamin-dependent protein, partial [Acidobacteriota bacterium]